jgi:hypothetical protein
MVHATIDISSAVTQRDRLIEAARPRQVIAPLHSDASAAVTAQTTHTKRGCKPWKCPNVCVANNIKVIHSDTKAAVSSSHPIYSRGTQSHGVNDTTVPVDGITLKADIESASTDTTWFENLTLSDIDGTQHPNWGLRSAARLLYIQLGAGSGSETVRLAEGVRRNYLDDLAYG